MDLNTSNKSDEEKQEENNIYPMKDSNNSSLLSNIKPSNKETQQNYLMIS